MPSGANEKTGKLCSTVRDNMLRVVAGITNLGKRVDTGEELSPAELAEAVEKISGKSYAAVRRGLGEKPSLREIIEAATGIRWNCAPQSLRSFLVGVRTPTFPRHEKFFADATEFGGVRFAKNGGAVVKETIGRGPSIDAVLRLRA